MLQIYSSYLYERRYQKDYLKENNSQKRDYWLKMLGVNIWDIVLKNHIEVMDYLNEYPFTTKVRKEVENLQEYISQSKDKAKYNYTNTESKSYFEEFYSIFIEYGRRRLQNEIGQNADYVMDKVYLNFQLQLRIRLQKICLRTLIVKMHEYKENGLLIGENPKDQYRYFCSSVIIRKSFILDVFDQYPVLCRCVSEAIEKMVSYYAQIIHHFQADKEAIQQCFSLERSCNKIYKIEGDFSDVHNYGRQVVKVQMGHGIELLYYSGSVVKT